MYPLFHLTKLRLTEQPAKMLYLALALAAGILAWIMLSAFSLPSLLPTSKAIKSELEIANARAQNTSFPARHIPRIQQIPGADNIYWFTAAAFYCADGSGTTVTVYGWDGDVDDYLREKGASQTDLAAWHASENGVLVGSNISRQCGLSKGITISPDNIFGNGEIPLHVVAVLSGQKGQNTHVNGHYHYINRLMEGHLGDPVRDMVMRAFINVKDLSMLDRLAQTIEQEFQSFDPPLEVTVRGDAPSLLKRFVQVQALLLLIIGALALCVLLAFIAMTAHLVAQRRASMAILQTLGFNGRMQFFALSLELGGVIVLGGLIGITAGYGALTLLTPWATNTLYTGALRPADGAILALLLVLLLLWASSLIWPAIQIKKLRPMDHQRF